MIYAIHGAVEARDAELFSHRIMHDRAVLERFLRDRPSKFGSVEDALAGRCDALTIDDATGAGGFAVELAVRHGHQATIFVNPYYVESGASYFFNILNEALDATRQPTVNWGGTVYSLATFDDRRRFRKVIQQRYRKTALESDRLKLVEEVAERMGVPGVKLSSCSRTLSLADLKALVAVGVRLENHGWTHVDYSTLTDSEIKQEMYSGRTWLEAKSISAATLFAVPFGQEPPRAVAGVCACWLMLTGKFPEGALTAPSMDYMAWNRVTPELEGA